jgi:hypothetical protein
LTGHVYFNNLVIEGSLGDVSSTVSDINIFVIRCQFRLPGSGSVQNICEEFICLYSWRLPCFSLNISRHYKGVRQTPLVKF